MAGKKKAGRKGKKPKKVAKKIVRPPSPPPPPIRPPSPPLTQGEFICVHIGQAGVQVGSACWELFCLEHGINIDGTVNLLTTDSTSFFSSSQTDSYVPRALLVDTEPSVIDTLRTGSRRKRFPTQCLISGNESAASNYAAGFYGVGKKLSTTVMDQLSRLAEDCSSLQGIVLFRSIGGGTGSGMGSRIIKTIKSTYPSKTIIDFNICSSPEMVPVIVEPYNAAFTTSEILDDVKCSMLFDNKSLYNICDSKLYLPNPSLKNINEIIAQVTSGLTSSLRFEGSITRNFTNLLTNLIPQPRLHFPIITYGPITNNIHMIPSTCIQLAALSLDRTNQMIKMDPTQGKYMSVCMMFRGDLKPTEINTTIAYIQREQSFPVTANMNSPLFKFGLCYQRVITMPGSEIIGNYSAMTALSNNTAVKHRWINMMENYNKLLSKRVFLHHYIGEGMDEGSFNATNENMSKLIEEYDQIEKSQKS